MPSVSSSCLFLWTVALLTVLGSSSSLGHGNGDARGKGRRLDSASIPTFVEKDGVIVMEAESVPVDFPWVKEATRDGLTRGFTGDGYHVMTGNSVKGGPPNGRLRYGLQIGTPGTYRMMFRGLKNYTTTSEGNDVYTKMVGFPGKLGRDLKTFQGGKGKVWQWNTVHQFQHGNFSVAKYHFDAPGVYEFEIAGRSLYFHLDRIVFFLDGVVSESSARSLRRPVSERVMPRDGDDEDDDDDDEEDDAPTPNPSIRSPPPPGLDAQVTKLSLVDAEKNVVLEGYESLGERTVIYRKDLPTQLNVVATVGGAATPQSVQFRLNGEVFRTENGAPWTLAGDSNGNFFEWNPTPDSYTLTVTPYSEKGAQGPAGASTTIVLVLKPGSAAPTAAPRAAPTAAPVGSPATALLDARVVSLDLMNADSNLPVAGFENLASGVELYLGRLPPKLNILATVQGADVPQSVQFVLNDEVFRTENGAPWTLAGDAQGDLFDWTPEPGSFTLTVTPYSQTLAQGIAGTSRTIDFTVLPGAPACPPRETPVKFLSAGDVESRTLAGTVWEGDALYRTAGKVYHNFAASIAKAPPGLEGLYQTTRWGVFDYSVPLPQGLYRVVLHFCDIWKGTTTPGSRRFNVALQNQLVLEEVDIVEAAGGPNTAYTWSAEVHVTALLHISFRKGTVENPTVAGIQIFALEPC